MPLGASVLGTMCAATFGICGKGATV